MPGAEFHRIHLCQRIALDKLSGKTAVAIAQQQWVTSAGKALRIFEAPSF